LLVFLSAAHAASGDAIPDETSKAADADEMNLDRVSCLHISLPGKVKALHDAFIIMAAQISNCKLHRDRRPRPIMVILLLSGKQREERKEKKGPRGRSPPLADSCPPNPKGWVVVLQVKILAGNIFSTAFQFSQ
jgi:hypothetical protein